MTLAPKGKRIRRVAGAATLGVALMAAGTAAAEAAQTGVQGPGTTASYATYFWGRTEVCFQNVSGSGGKDVAYNWWSSTSNGSGYLTPGQASCMTRSFVGFRIGVYNIGGGTLQVTFPIGP